MSSELENPAKIQRRVVSTLKRRHGEYFYQATLQHDEHSLLLKNSMFNILALKVSIYNICHSVGSGNVSETQYSIFSRLKKSIFNILKAQKLNIQYSNIRCGGLPVMSNEFY